MPTIDLIWFQHFHKAGGTSVIDSARSAGYTFHEPNVNGNPKNLENELIKMWEWSAEELSDWLLLQSQKGINFISAEFGFSHEIFDVTTPRLKRVGIIRHPKGRLISNFIYDASKGYTKATTIFDYMNPEKVHTMPDYYTRLITHSTGSKARQSAIEAINRFDYISILEKPETFPILQSFIPGLGALRHSNRTNYRDSAVQDAWETVQKYDEEIDALCFDEAELYHAVSTNFSKSL